MSNETPSTKFSAETQAWAPRRQLDLADVRRHTERVQILRKVFLAVAAVIVLAYLGSIIANALRGQAELEMVNAEEVITMVNPRFTGRDLSGVAFAITAERAKAHPQEGGVVELQEPVLSDSSGTLVSAPSGMYNRDGGVLDLYEDVVFIDASGYAFNTTEARIYIDEDRVVGKKPVTGKGPMGSVRADSYEILDGGRRTLLKGNACMLIHEEGKEDETAPCDSDVRTGVILQPIDDGLRR